MTVPSAPGKGKKIPDAGLKALDHYKKQLPPWRYRLRKWLLPLIRCETPYLAAIQRRVRTPALDRYFAITANLGTHTFFSLLLPLQFWFGAPGLGKALVQILSCGVFFTSIIKDLCSLPRPLSPPLCRITMSGSTALEYGFPSTHSANAVSMTVYCVLLLRSTGVEAALGAHTAGALEVLAYFYAATIVLGRIYCGMHGFLDVVVGSAVGAAIALAVFFWGPWLDAVMHASSWLAPVLATLLCIGFVWFHPEPADDCPCFDDSVAVAGVVIGVEIGTWTHGRIASDPWTGSSYGGVPPPISALSSSALVARVVVGLVVVFGWRGITKPALLRGLPHVFRLISRLGLTRPRRFFVQADDYTFIQPDSRIDNTIPDMHELPRAIDSIRNPAQRGRSVSIGPQSAADAYETLAYRERQRRESASSTPKGGVALATGRAVAGASEVVLDGGEEDEKHEAEQADLDRRRVFSQIVRPRMRYDVEVVTKLVVYIGIALIASMLMPIAFELIGLGTNRYRLEE